MVTYIYIYFNFVKVTLQRLNADNQISDPG